MFDIDDISFSGSPHPLAALAAEFCEQDHANAHPAGRQV
jgi:hypothetical protein